MGDPRLARDPRRRAQQQQQQQQQQEQPTPAPPQPVTSTPPASSTPQPPPPPPASPPPNQGTDGASDSNAQSNGTTPDEGFKLKFCTVCASNNNRSMEAHLRLSLAHFPVISFGTGSLVRLPGPSITQPYVYPFNVTSYEQMHDELSTKDPRLNRANGVLNMLERNKTVKFGPERWQDWAIGIPRLERFKNDKGSPGTEGGVVDVVITCEERCWEAVVDNLLERGSPLNRPVHVINVDIKDSHEEALVGGRGILDLATSLNQVAVEEREKAGATAWDVGTTAARSGFDQRVPEVLASWQDRWPNLPALWTLSWL